MEQKKDDIKQGHERMDSESNTYAKVEQKNPKQEASGCSDKVVTPETSKTSIPLPPVNKNPASTPAPQH